MRDAMRAVCLVIGVILVLAGGAGFVAGKRGVPEYVGVGLGAAFLLTAAFLPPGERPPVRRDEESW
ncbi:MAG TPA: hypothetical protein VM529_27075 [Gemmata sp.]|jgi:hypothetical protein|nr:hypothetical protein [Gemmata sp.]